MHRNKHSPSRPENQVNASWPDFGERKWERLDHAPREEGLTLTANLGKSFLPISRRSNRVLKAPRRQQRDKLRSLEVKQKLLARVQVTELLQSLRTDQFMGKFNLLSHSKYVDSPGSRIPGKTSSADAASVGSSLSSGPPSPLLGHVVEKLHGSTSERSTN